MSALPVLRAEWPAAGRVQGLCTTRAGGVSRGRYASLNLAAHVGDEALAVTANRQRLRAALQLPAEPLWLNQVHGISVLDAAALKDSEAMPAPSADAAVTCVPGQVLAVMVADCMPVLMARADGGAVGIAHAGWRGLAGGVLEACAASLGDAATLQVWLGPAIGRSHFEVGDEVRQAFCAHDPAATAAFQRNARDRWQCDLGLLARQRLAAAGVERIYGQPACTYQQHSLFSYRRDRDTGRMAALIWIGEAPSP